MKILNKQELDFKIMKELNKVPFGANIKDFFLADFLENARSYDEFFEGQAWDELNEDARQERVSLFESFVAKFDLERKVFDK